MQISNTCNITIIIRIIFCLRTTLYAIYSHLTRMPRYGWNIAKVGIKHQSINQSFNQLLLMNMCNRWFSLTSLTVTCNWLLTSLTTCSYSCFAPWYQPQVLCFQTPTCTYDWGIHLSVCFISLSFSPPLSQVQSSKRKFEFTGPNKIL